MASCAREWFHEHVAATAVERSHDYETTLTDLFVMQHGNPVELADLCRVFAAHSMTALGTTPPLRAAGCDGNDVFDYVAHRDAYRVLERAWMDWSPRPTGELTEPAEAVLARIERRIRDRDIDDALIAELRRGRTVDRIFVLAAKQ
jgi:nucleotide-binding universal stress UspA family protein